MHDSKNVDQKHKKGKNLLKLKAKYLSIDRVWYGPWCVCIFL